MIRPDERIRKKEKKKKTKISKSNQKKMEKLRGFATRF